MIAWEEYSGPLLMKATGGSQGEWWAGRLAECNISSTFEDVNINFNYALYYSMSRSDGRVVIDKR